jgi:pimeloyl-ACP methyl ester carboxylesterase
MRAVRPASSGFVERDGLQVAYEVYGDGDPTVFLLMPDMIVHSHAWKAQVPFLARSFRVVVIDPRGNGRSEAPSTPEALTIDALMGDAWAVLDAVGAEQAVLVGLCSGAGQSVVMAAERPERVLGVFAINPGLGLAPHLSHKLEHDFRAALDTEAGWAKLNQHYWQRDWPGFAEFFFAEMFPEPHSTKQREDCVGWALRAGVELMLLDADAPPDRRFRRGAAEICQRVRCPVFVVTGSLDRCQNPERSRVLAELTGAEHVVIEGGGHLPNARDPVHVNLLIRDFVRRVAPGRHGG